MSKKFACCAFVFSALFAFAQVAFAQDGNAEKSTSKTLPIFKDGEAQIVEGFKDAKDWIRDELWVETEFDSDGDKKKDRVHVSVARQKQTETEGLKVPVILVYVGGDH